ncbi:MAG: hypothetical protein CMJ51_00445 [Planctomycetaceae bacterium]|nr:hypothetical protein [Planctomycetaceae bacterium]
MVHVRFLARFGPGGILHRFPREGRDRRIIRRRGAPREPLHERIRSLPFDHEPNGGIHPAHEPRRSDDRTSQTSRTAWVATQTPKVMLTWRFTRSPASSIRSAS